MKNIIQPNYIETYTSQVILKYVYNATKLMQGS